jgi:hypothetical protein
VSKNKSQAITKSKPTKKHKVRLKWESVVNTFAHLNHANAILINIIKSNPPGWLNITIMSTVFSAFTFEAYLNHIGGKLVPFWSDIEKSIKMKEKLSVISKQSGFAVDFGTEPWQTIKQLFQFRNEIAHGKTERLVGESIVEIDSMDELNDDNRPKTKWEKMISREFMLKCNVAVNEAIMIMHKAAKLEGLPIMFGTYSSSSQMLTDFNPEELKDFIHGAS